MDVRVGVGGRGQSWAEVQRWHLVTLKQFILLHDPVESSLHHSETAVLLLVSCQSRQSTSNGRENVKSGLERDQAEITPMGCREAPTPKCAGGAPKGQPRLCSNQQLLVQCHLPSPSLAENAMRHAPCAMRHVHVTAIQCAQGDVTYARVSLDVDEVDGLYAEHLREDSAA